MNAKVIFNRIKYLNPELSTISSLGDFISESDRLAQEATKKEVIANISEDSLAYKIVTSSSKFTDKQLWVIAYELLKNEDYVSQVAKEEARAEGIAAQEEREKKAKLDANKASSEPVKDFIKENGALLKDYYAFVKSSKKFKREFYSKKFTMESANAFLNK